MIERRAIHTLLRLAFEDDEHSLQIEQEPARNTDFTGDEDQVALGRSKVQVINSSVAAKLQLVHRNQETAGSAPTLVMAFYKLFSFVWSEPPDCYLFAVSVSDYM